MTLDQPKEKWGRAENALFGRVVEGLLSVLLATRKLPVIRYQASSELCKRIAFSLKVHQQ